MMKNSDINYVGRRERGSALILVVVFGVIISIMATFAYRSTIFQTRMADRSSNYLNALNIAEAGGELAMVELNKAKGTGFTGWNGSDPALLSTTITDHNNVAVGDVDVSVTGMGATPRITATGYIPNKANAELMRTVVLSTKSDTVASPWGEFGLFSYGYMKFNGGMSVDSFDPKNPSVSTKKSTVGSLGNMSFYGSQTIYGNIQAGGDLWFANNSIKILGDAFYGGTLGFPKWNDPQIAGDRKKVSIRTPDRVTAPVKPTAPASFNNGNVKIRPLNGGGITRDGLATNANLSLSNSKVTFTAPGNYKMSSFGNNSNSQFEVVGDGKVQIFVDGNFDMSGLSQTEIKGLTGATGANVTIVANNFNTSTYGPHKILGTSELNVFANKISSGYGMTMSLDEKAKVMFSAKELDFGGGASINVKNGTPGTTTNALMYATEKANFGQGANIAGVFYGPDAKTNFSGGFNWWGAVIGKDIDIQGGANLKVDQTLFTPSSGAGAFITAWTEVSPIKM